MMGYGWGMGTGTWLAMTVFWVALLALMGWAVSRAFPTTRGGESPPRESPQEILSRRYAAGELDTQTYQEMRAALESAHSAGR